MSHLRFTDLDPARVVVGTTAGPVAEAIFALDLFGRPESAVHHAWRAQVRLAMATQVPRPLACTTTFTLPELLWLLTGHGAATGDIARRQVRAVNEFRALAVTPYWPRIRAYLERQRDVYGRILVGGGVEQVLTAVHPRARWQAPVLDLPLERRAVAELDGRGLVLVPSLFLRPGTCVLLDPPDRGARSSLAFPVPSNQLVADTLWEAAASPEDALAALMGRTRAGILEAARNGASTGELARRLGISAAGASQHTAVLRSAGLINTRRERNAAVHTITSLGAALLGSDGLVAAG